MTKKILVLVMASCALGSSIGATYEMRTPISLLSKLDNINGSFHYPLMRVKPVLCESTNVNFWAGAYYRSAFSGFCPKRCDSCCSLPESCTQGGCDHNFFGGVCGCTGGSSSSCGSCCNNNGICLSNTNYIGCVSCPDNKVSLAQLIFGQSSFTGSEAFAPGAIPQGYYSYLSTVTMSPKLDYKETGVVIGMHLERQVVDSDWRFAFNAALPIKQIEVTSLYNCDSVLPSGTTDGSAGFTAYNFPEMYFNEHGVRICDSENIVGLGDLETALVFGYDFADRVYAEVVGEVKFPTSKRNLCPGRVYYMPTGNNGHFETKIGIDTGWRSRRWVGIRADAAYGSVLQAVEKKAAQFKCATVRGIGPCIDAKVKYGFFLGHLDLTVFHPQNQDMGLALGYEIYYKRHDKVKFCPCNGADRAEDFFGHVYPIDPALMIKNTDVLAHKIRGQIFTRWNYIELYAGASKVVGGFNGMAENELHLGLDVNF